MSKTIEAWDLHLASLAESTGRIYRRNLRYFMERWDYTEESLYEARWSHLESRDTRDKTTIPNQVKAQMKEMVKSGKSGSTARNLYKAVKSFMESQGLDFIVKARDKPARFHNGSQLILKKQIKGLLEHVGNEFRKRNIAIILTLKDSGLRVGDLSRMNVGHFRDTVIKGRDGEDFAIFEAYTTEKTGAPAFIHLGPEAIEALDQYLETREIGHKSPLFVGRQGRMTSGSLSQVVIRLASFLGSDGRKITAHSIRKFFQTSLEARGINSNFVGKYNGRQATGSTGAYSLPEEVPGLLFDTYAKNYDALRLIKNGNVLELRTRIKELEAKDIQIEELRAENREIRDQMREIWELLKKEG